MTTEEVADKLGYHVQYVRFLAAQKKIPALKRGRAWRFNEAEIMSWLKKQTNEATGAGNGVKGNDSASDMLR